MTLFWIIAAAMIIAALGLLAPTLLRKHATAADDTEQLNVGIAREHLQELTKQREAGELSEEEFAQAKQDLEKALAHDLAGTADAPPVAKTGGGGRVALVLSVVLVPLIAIPTYLEIGSPGLITQQPMASAGPGGHGGADLPPISELAAQLRERLEANPGNAEGWFLLGRTYMRMSDYAQAADAFGRVVELIPQEPAALLSLADALTMRDGRSGPRAVALLEQALEIQPDSVTALWLLGSAALDAGRTEEALDYWQRAHPLLVGEPGMQAELGRMIANAGGEVPASPASLPPIMPTANSQPATAPAPVTETETTTAETVDESGVAVNVAVALSPSLLDQAADNDTVFVLARAESGPPMPLAVARHRVADLPIEVTLTDAMAMMPAMKLSSFPRVAVTAKLSKSGQAGSQPGDIESEAVVVETANPPDRVELLLDRVVE
jgi:cytochrome c-type biogenesis protein CcmH